MEMLKSQLHKLTTLPYFANNYPLKILEKQIENSIDLIDGKFVIR